MKAIKSLYLNSRAAVRVEGELSEWFEAMVLIYMHKIIKSSNLRGTVVLDGNVISARAFADNLALFGSLEQELQNS